MGELEIKIRPVRDSDTAFITNSWKESYRWSPDARWVPNGPYFHEINKRVPELMKRGQVLVACNPVDDDHILGWICTEGETLHYVYVKTPMRGAGYALALIKAAMGKIPERVTCSHWTEHCERFARNHNWQYVPSTTKCEKRAA
jgi:hypothetical protein